VRLLPVHDTIPQEVIDRWEHENNARRLLGVGPSPFTRTALGHRPNHDTDGLLLVNKTDPSLRHMKSGAWEK
jgi:hypothetical protein